MQKTVNVRGVPPKFCKDPGLETYKPRSMTAAAKRRRKKSQAEKTLGTSTAVDRAQRQFYEGRYTAKTQPRDERGQFRNVLARLRFDLGKKQLFSIVAKIREAEVADEIGDYQKSTEAGTEVLELVEKIDKGVLDATSIKNVRQGARELGKVLAHLPMPQGDENATVRYSDLPPSTQQLIDDMMDKVSGKIGAGDAAAPLANLKAFLAGGEMMTSDQILKELNLLLRLLT